MITSSFDTHIFLVYNKMDLEKTVDSYKTKTIIKIKLIRQLGLKWGRMDFINVFERVRWMVMKTLPVVQGDYQLKDYDRTVEQFNWTDVEKEFSWFESGLMNIAHEAVDRHADSYRKNKVALYYKDANRKETYTYNEMKKMSNNAA